MILKELIRKYEKDIEKLKNYLKNKKEYKEIDFRYESKLITLIEVVDELKELNIIPIPKQGFFKRILKRKKK